MLNHDGNSLVVVRTAIARTEELQWHRVDPATRREPESWASRLRVKSEERGADVWCGQVATHSRRHRADRVRGDLRTVRLRAHQGGPRALLRRDRRVGAPLRIAFVPNLRVALDDMDAPYLRPVSSAGSGLSA